MNIQMDPIGIIHSPFTESEGTPIQPVMSDEKAIGRIEIFPEFREGIKDLSEFERIWLIYFFHKAKPPRLTVKPYMDNHSRGLFATRAPSRPNPIGISSVKIIKIENNIIHISYLDILNGTPLLDIKPYCPKFDVFKVEKSGWLDDKRRHEDFKADGRFEK